MVTRQSRGEFTGGANGLGLAQTASLTEAGGFAVPSLGALTQRPLSGYPKTHLVESAA